MASIDEQLKNIPELKQAPWESSSTTAGSSQRNYAADFAKVTVRDVNSLHIPGQHGTSGQSNLQGSPFTTGYVFGRNSQNGNIFVSNDCVQDQTGNVYALSGREISKSSITSYESLKDMMNLKSSSNR